MTNHSSQTTGEPCRSQLTELGNTVILENSWANSILGVTLPRSAILPQRWIWPTFLQSLSSHHCFNRKQTIFLKLQINSTEAKSHTTSKNPVFFLYLCKSLDFCLTLLIYHILQKTPHRPCSCHWQLNILSLWQMEEIILIKN